MTQAVTRRLARLETALLPASPGVRDLTDDELEIRILDLSRRLAGDPTATPAERDDVAQRVRSIEAGMRALACRQRKPDYQAHLDWCRRTMPGFVPAVCAADPAGFEETADAGRPRTMRRRAALRARPDIATLIEGASP